MKRKWLLIPLITVAGLIMIARITGGLQYYSIPSGSNEPTIRVGGHLIASNFIKPKLLDFMCYRQAATENFPAGIWVKRVCGMPGDKVQIIDGALFVNGRNVDSGLRLETAVYKARSINGHMYIDTSVLPETVKVFGHPWTLDNFGPVRVPIDKYFVLGDNRHESADSRFLGFVDAKDYRGTVVKIF